jgi:hypothetical protein
MVCFPDIVLVFDLITKYLQSLELAASNSLWPPRTNSVSPQVSESHAHGHMKCIGRQTKVNNSSNH